MSSFTLTHLAKIIERDSKDSTYKFALLRGTIDTIQNYPHFLEIEENKASYPMGLLVLKWIEYYYPLLAYQEFIPQKHGDDGSRTIAFRKEFNDLLQLYPNTSNYFSLNYDLKKGISEAKRVEIIIRLIRKLRDTIVKQPMKYIGSAIQRGGDIYSYTGHRSRNPSFITTEWIIQNLGNFYIPIDFYTVLRDVGSFVAGTNSIIFKWAEFTSALSKDVRFHSSDIITLLSDKESSRDVVQARDFYQNIVDHNTLQCVWTGKRLTKEMHVDHLLPFSALQNNDLWNLLPVTESINMKKSDRIPTAGLLNESSIKERIIHTWESLVQQYRDQFFQEISIALLGKKPIDNANWQNPSYKGLVTMADFLINQRSLTPWEYNIM